MPTPSIHHTRMPSNRPETSEALSGRKRLCLRWQIFLLPGLLCASIVCAIAAEQPIIAAASSLRLTWPVLEEAWGGDTRATFGASGTLARQIVTGAPFELFLTADKASADFVEAAGKASFPAQAFATGELALIWNTARVSIVKSCCDSTRSMLAELINHADMRMSIANPQHAPYGDAARQTLNALGLWEKFDGRLALGENAAQAFQYVRAGAAEAGLIPMSLVIGAGGTVRLKDESLAVLPVDKNLHSPVIHYILLLTEAGDAARTLYEWLTSDSAATTLAAYGFKPASP